MITQQPAQPQSQPEPQDKTAHEGSYVDSYQPPQPTPTPSVKPTPTPSQPASIDNPASSPQPSATPQYPSDLQPPVPVAPATVVTPNQDESKIEPLQEQNIFHLLGVEGNSDEEKEAFLDELQQVIWEDFIEDDTKILISEEEMAELRRILAKGNKQESQEAAIAYLEKLIPDLEEIMLEKALELKEDMVWERIAGMREYYANKPDFLAKIDQAEQLARKELWHQMAEVLNTLLK